jgi:aminopeptidase N
MSLGESMAEKLRLSDYKEPSYWTKKTDLTFEIKEDYTLVSNQIHLYRNLSRNENIVLLNGDGQEIIELSIDGKSMEPHRKDKDIVLDLSGKEHIVFIKTKIFPKDNKSFEGLYASNNKYFTQCEAEGFRKITYYQDRPDVLAKFTTTIVAKGYPVLLSNGNLVKKEQAGELTKVVWEDPFPKPAYLFALVAGHFDKITDSFTTRSKREVLLEVYVDAGMTLKATHAMKSVKESMKWDEDRYDLEYDLDRYMIVAANDFNFGAMENKGLNIFNAKYVLADTESATDIDFYNIQSVVGHEYFHNWTGNRVTCRDWFQLSLKEGLTVYRDQEFSSDLNSRGVKRIDDVIRLRTSQFSEDAGGNSHPVRPSEAFNISNFYTATIYEKGAELIRMIETLIGREAFKAGIAKYFELFDGQAVTTEDFCFAMSEASGRDLHFFQKWYTQKGTPKLEVTRDDSSEYLKLNFKQLTSPLLLPVLTGFISNEGKALKNIKVIDATCDVRSRDDSLLFEITKEQESITLDVPKDARVSLLRDFSSPIIVKYNGIKDEIYDLAAFDTNSFSKWEALQQLVTNDILSNIKSLQNAKVFSFDDKLVSIYRKILRDPVTDAAYIAKLISFPRFDNIKLEFESTFPVDEIYQTLQSFKAHIASSLETELLKVFESQKSIDSSGARSLKNTILSILCTQSRHLPLADKQFQSATNMTDKLGALQAIKNSGDEIFNKNIRAFHQTWNKDALVYTKYLDTVFTRSSVDALEELKDIHSDPAFQNWNPNHNYSSYAALALANPVIFHDKSGKVYEVIAKRILELDEKNPYVAARLASCFNDFKKLDPTRKPMMKQQLENLLSHKISSNTYEILYNALN